jgi:hypothetical protein
MVEAIRFVLEQHGFKAGPYTVGYQSCDDSTAQAGKYDLYKELSNRKAYARNLAVVSVIGTLLKTRVENGPSGTSASTAAATSSKGRSRSSA